MVYLHCFSTPLLPVNLIGNQLADPHVNSLELRKISINYSQWGKTWLAHTPTVLRKKQK